MPGAQCPEFGQSSLDSHGASGHVWEKGSPAAVSARIRRNVAAYHVGRPDRAWGLPENGPAVLSRGFNLVGRWRLWGLA